MPREDIPNGKLLGFGVYSTDTRDTYPRQQELIYHATSLKQCNFYIQKSLLDFTTIQLSNLLGYATSQVFALQQEQQC